MFGEPELMGKVVDPSARFVVWGLPNVIGVCSKSLLVVGKVVDTSVEAVAG